MRRSTHVAAPLLAAAALTLTSGCRKPEMQRCVDESNRVVADNLCGPGQQRRSDGHGGFIPLPYRYYYGGSGGFGLGTPVNGGSLTPVPGRSYGNATSRGGFGSTLGGGHGGGGGGEGGGE